MTTMTCGDVYTLYTMVCYTLYMEGVLCGSVTLFRRRHRHLRGLLSAIGKFKVIVVISISVCLSVGFSVIISSILLPLPLPLSLPLSTSTSTLWVQTEGMIDNRLRSFGTYLLLTAETPELTDEICVECPVISCVGVV